MDKLMEKQICVGNGCRDEECENAYELSLYELIDLIKITLTDEEKKQIFTKEALQKVEQISDEHLKRMEAIN